MTPLEELAQRSSPGIFAGLTLRQWVTMLRDNRFAVDLPFWPGAAIITAASILNTVAGVCDSIWFRRRVERTTIESPLFVLGVWRSGTTLLHNLLCADRRFAYGNYFEVVYPNSFLCTERIMRPILGLFLPKSRVQDNVLVSTSEPAEDEVATAILTHKSMLFSWSFFRNQDYYDRLLTYRGATTREISEWQSALLLFMKKLTWKYGRPLVLKSPGHTGRIRLLLEMFPDARFVHICRNPYEVFQSSEHTFRKASTFMALQRPNYENALGRNLSQYRELCDAYFEERNLIPAGRLHELRFEDLETNPLAEVEKIYDALALPDFETVRADLSTYVESLKGYQRNRFPNLHKDLRARIAHEWQRSFKAWGYDPNEVPSKL